MAKDFEEIHRLEDMTDEDLRELVRQEIREYPELDADRVNVTVHQGVVTLSGRVGTEGELQQAEALLTDVIGVEKYTNNLVVDELVRAEHSEAADDAALEDDAVDSPLGEAGERTDPQADHLLEDLEAEMYGTENMQQAIERGESYNPPDRPVQEGTWSRENH